MGIEILKVNPSYIKVHNQYVECYCGEDERRKIERGLEEVDGVTDVEIITEPEKLGMHFCSIRCKAQMGVTAIVRRFLSVRQSIPTLL